MKKNLYLIGFFYLFLLGNVKLEAKVILPNLFGDNMLLQQGTTIKLWGKAEPLKTVSVQPSWNQKGYRSKADADGRWEIAMKTPVYGGPYSLDISDGETLRLENILIGDVWFCSGQSNMEMPLAGWGEIMNYEGEIKNANYPEIRLLQTVHTAAQKPNDEAALWEGGWKVCTSQSIPEFSSTAYFFAREIYQKTGIPIGLVHSSWGGTYVEAWMSEAALTNFSSLRDAYDEMKAKRMDDFDSKNGNQPTVLYNAMVEPFIDFPIKGAIWYQGESNADRPAAYRELFPAMIKDWRSKWKQGNFPFYFVQLANFMKKSEEPEDSNWAMLREAQTYALQLPSTGMAVTIDIGDADDIHPKNKQEVGRRLALQALRHTYDKKVVSSGPVLASYKTRDNEILLSFESSADELVLNEQADRSFAIAGKDRKFYWAQVRKAGGQLIVSSPKVPEPVALRYAWANNPDTGLLNGEGLPASSFRTDNWEK